MLIGLIIGFSILTFILITIGDTTFDDKKETLCMGFGALSLIVSLGIIIFGFFHGYINYPATEGTHQGVVTAVDLEGKYFRRYEVYLKSSGYTDQSDETKYLCYDNETELIGQLKNAIGKTVKINYGHDGGYIGWNSCGTYHIKSIEIIEEN